MPVSTGRRVADSAPSDADRSPSLPLSLAEDVPLSTPVVGSGSCNGEDESGGGQRKASIVTAIGEKEREEGQQQQQEKEADEEEVEEENNPEEHSEALPVVHRPPSGWSLERAQGWTNKASKGLAAASLAHQAGFVAAKAGTKFGLGIARFATKASLTLPAMAMDAAMGTVPTAPWSRGSANVGRASLSGATGAGVDALFNFIDTITHGSIGVGEKVSELGLALSQRGVDQLQTALSAEVVRSLATFTRLVKSEWGATTDEHLPPGGLPAFDNVTIARALLCWISLQTINRPRIEKDTLAEMKLVRRGDFSPSRVETGNSPPAEHTRATSTDDMSTSHLQALSAAHRVQRLVTHARLMLAVYGGAFLLLLDQHPDGIRSTPDVTNEAVLFVRDCVTRGSNILGTSYQLPRLPSAAAQRESYYRDEPHSDFSHPARWNMDGIPYAQLLQGAFDDSLLHVAAGVTPDDAVRGSYETLDKDPTQVELAPEDLDQEAEVFETHAPDGVPTTTSRPRYYVITSHHNRKITLVLRGTVTAGDVATDLTCRAVSASPLGSHLPPGSKAHEGVMQTALALGLPGRPLHTAVWKQLQSHPSYDIELVGHSLGAGVVAALAVLWADPGTGRTLPSMERAGRRVSRSKTDSGADKPQDGSLGGSAGCSSGPEAASAPASASSVPTRALHAFAYACPPTFDPALAEYCKPTVTAFVCNHDLVPRLSLQSVLGIRNAIAWICYWDTEAHRQATAASRSPDQRPSAPSGPLPIEAASRDPPSDTSSSPSTTASTLPASDATPSIPNSSSSTPSAAADRSKRDQLETCPVPNFSTLTLLRKTFEHQAGRLGGPFTRARVDFERDASKLYSALRSMAPEPVLAIPGRVFAVYERDALLTPPASFVASPGEASGDNNTTSFDARARATSTATSSQPASTPGPGGPGGGVAGGSTSATDHSISAGGVPLFSSSPAPTPSTCLSAHAPILTSSGAQTAPEQDVQARIYEVTGSRTKAFGQIFFWGGMLEAHFPRIYARVLTQLLDTPRPSGSSMAAEVEDGATGSTSDAASTVPVAPTTAQEPYTPGGDAHDTGTFGLPGALPSPRDPIAAYGPGQKLPANSVFKTKDQEEVEMSQSTQDAVDTAAVLATIGVTQAELGEGEHGTTTHGDDTDDHRSDLFHDAVHVQRFGGTTSDLT